MSYLVMETNTSYAVVLDPSGRFLKVANLGYEVGQTVEEIIEMKEEKEIRKRVHRIPYKITAVASAAACVLLAFLLGWHFFIRPQGSVRMQINPDVEITVNRLDYVLKLEGLNEDGKTLVKGISGFGKKIEEISDLLGDRAVELDYLKEGGRIQVTVESADGTWKTATEEKLLLELQMHFQNRIEITVGEDEEKGTDTENKIIIPVVPETETSGTGSSGEEGNSQSFGAADEDDRDDDTDDRDDDTDDRDDDTDDRDDDADDRDDDTDDRDDDADDREDDEDDDGDEEDGEEEDQDDDAGEEEPEN